MRGMRRSPFDDETPVRRIMFAWARFVFDGAALLSDMRHSSLCILAMPTEGLYTAPHRLLDSALI